MLKILTIPFDPGLELFADEVLQAFVKDQEVVSHEAHFFEHGGRPYCGPCCWTCVHCRGTPAEAPPPVPWVRTGGACSTEDGCADSAHQHIANKGHVISTMWSITSLRFLMSTWSKNN